MKSDNIQIDFEGSGLRRQQGSLAAKIFEATAQQDENGEYVFTRNLWSEEEYAVKSMIATTELINVCEQMGYCVDFLTGFRSKNFPEHSNITRLDYIVYHLENYFIRTGMVLDRSLLLVNIVFQLGLPEKQCRMATVAENHHVARTTVQKSLKRILKTVSPVQAKRNTVIHERGYTDEELKELEIFSVLEKTGSDTAKKYFHLSKTMTDNAVASKKEELQKINQEVFKDVIALFDSLEEIFNVKFASLIHSRTIEDLPK